jgi:hypothetical protein
LGEDSKRTGAAFAKRNWPRGRPTKAATGAPVLRRQLWQWQ